MKAIISASRRTDIPAFFSDWFMERVNEGVTQVVNPFNPRQVKAQSLRPEDVEAIVFWSKDPRPLTARLDELDSRGYKYYFQFTLNDYSAGSPSWQPAGPWPDLEPGVPPLSERLDTFRLLSGNLGPDRVIWRYDPIAISPATPPEYHLERLERIAADLDGYTRRLTISFMDFYSKAVRRLSRFAPGLVFKDIALPEHRPELLEFARRIKDVADRHGFSVATCSEAVDLLEAGIPHGACIDGALIRSLVAGDIATAAPGLRKDKGQRPECLCAKSVDIGTYNTCRHGCAYCYAVSE